MYKSATQGCKIEIQLFVPKNFFMPLGILNHYQQIKNYKS